MPDQPPLEFPHWSHQITTNDQLDADLTNLTGPARRPRAKATGDARPTITSHARTADRPRLRRFRVDPANHDLEVAPRGVQDGSRSFWLEFGCDSPDDRSPSCPPCWVANRGSGGDWSGDADELDDGAIGPADLTVGGLAWLVVIGVTWISVAGVAGAVLWVGSGVYRMLGGDWRAW